MLNEDRRTVRQMQDHALDDISRARSQPEIITIADKFVEECAKRGEAPFLSNLLVGISDGAQPIMQALERREAREINMSEGDRVRWKIRVLCDEWGNAPQPGDKVARVVMKNLFRAEGIPSSGRERSRAKVDGSYAAKFEDRFEFVVDEKGCITCGFTPAAYFLNVYGVHADTGHGLSSKPELSSGPSKAPNGQMLHVHYWRYKEADAAVYAALPKIEATDTPKRGR